MSVHLNSTAAVLPPHELDDAPSAYGAQDFSCPIVRINATLRIPGADAIELAFVLGYQVIVPRSRFAVGDLAIFIPDGAVLPPTLVDSVKGSTKLFGERKNRTKPFWLRGVMSEGILIDPLPAGQEGADCASMLGVRKYVELPPQSMRGECVLMPERVMRLGMENYRRRPNALPGGELVEMTEKIHGTFCAVSFVPGLRDAALLHGDTLVYSKGLGAEGFVFKDNDANAGNLYLTTVKRLDLRRRMLRAFGLQPMTIFGEIFGAAVQDLAYGREVPDFALFDVYLGMRGRGRFLDRAEMEALGSDVGDQAPALYKGPLNRAAIQEIATGSTVIGAGANIREGVVIRSATETRRRHRVSLKYISPEYLTRPRGTEFQ